MDKDQLAALDRAATQELLPCPFCGSTPDCTWRSASPFEGPDEGFWDITCCQAFSHEDTEELAIERWNRRTGKLVLIDDGAVERAGFAIWHKLGQIESNVRAGQLTEDEVREIATAALSALGVK